MRLLFVNQRLDYSSTTSYSFDLAAALRAKGDEVRFCTTGGDLCADFQAAGSEVYVAKFNLLSFRKLIEFLRDYDPHLIHVQNLRSAHLGRRLAIRIDRPYVVTVHRRPGPAIPRLDQPAPCGLMAVNEVIRESLVNDHNLPKSRIRVIKRGVNLEQLKPESSSLPAAGEARIPVIGALGRLSRAKGHHTLIEAARRVVEQGVEAHFAIVGEGEEEPRLRSLVKEFGLQQQVTFSPHIPRLQDLFRLFDIAVIPVLRSGVGVAALEAMAMGKPVIASGVGEMLHIVQDGQTGLLAPEGDSARLAECIVKLIRDPELAATLAGQARSWVEENFALRPMIDETREYYTELLAELREGTAGSPA